MAWPAFCVEFMVGNTPLKFSTALVRSVVWFCFWVCRSLLLLSRCSSALLGAAAPDRGVPPPFWFLGSIDEAGRRETVLTTGRCFSTMASFSYYDRRRDLAVAGKDNGLKSLGSRLYYASLQGVAAGALYGTFQWAYYPDKFTYSHKNTVLPGPTRGYQYLNLHMLRPAVYFSLIGITFATVESVLEDIRDNHSGFKSPWNSAAAGFCSGVVMGGFYTRRFDIASMTGVATGILMGAMEFNGPSIIVDPETQRKKLFPETVPTVFEESEDLSALKDKYPAYKNN